MGILIVFIIIFFVLGSGGMIVRFLVLSALRKRKGESRSVNTETMPDLPEAPEISDIDLKKELTLLKIFTWVRKLTIPVFVVIGLVFFFLNFEIGTSMYLDEFFFKILLPEAILFVLSFVSFIFTSNRIDKLKALMGSAITLPIIKELLDVKSYLPNGHINREIIASAGLIDNWEAISGSDYFIGSYNGVIINYSDVYLSHEETDTDSDGHKTTKKVTDFKGQWMVCDFGKELSAAVRLIERKGGTMFQRKYDGSKSDVETENMEFNKKFRIMTSDGHTAFYLLTPHFMERVMAVDEMAESSSLFCFQDSKVHIALYSGRDSFELKGVKLDNIDTVREKFRSDLKYLIDIVDELLLSERLFKEIQSETWK